MKKRSFVLGVICGAVLFGCGSAIAAGVTAVMSNNPFYINGEETELTAYTIAGHNYVRLRDVCKALDIGVTYDAETNSVYVNDEERYTEQMQTAPDLPVLKERHIDGQNYAREDFSQKANQVVFDEIYTRGAYNAIRQSIADCAEIIAGNGADGYNPNYNYAHFVDHGFTMETNGKTSTAIRSVLSVISGYYQYELGREPNISNYYEYPGYRICKSMIHTYFEPANHATEEFINSLSGCSKKEQVKRIVDEVCDRIVYHVEQSGGVNDVFTANEPVKGACGLYAHAFQYLCQRAGIESITVNDYDHAWNEVYIDGAWEIVDACNYDTARSETWICSKNYPKQDENMQRTLFAKELLVPGSTRD